MPSETEAGAAFFGSVNFYLATNTMAAPLHFARDQILHHDLQRVDLVQSTLDAPQLQFVLPKGAGAWDFAGSHLHLEYTVTDSANASVEPTESPKQLACEMLGDAVWQDVRCRIAGEDVSDEHGGNLAHIGSFYRKVVSKPVGWASGGTMQTSSSGAVERRGGAAIGAMVAGASTIDAPGLAEGYALSTTGPAFYDERNNGGADLPRAGYQLQVGPGGGADCVGTMNPQAAFRGSIVMRKDVAHLVLKSWPSTGLTTCGSLIPCKLPVELIFEKNRMNFQLSQGSTADSPLNFTLRACYLYMARVYPTAEAAGAIDRPIRAPWVNHRLVIQNVDSSTQAGAGQQTFTKVLTGTRPHKIIVALVAADAYGGGGLANRISPVAAGRHASITGGVTATGAELPLVAPYEQFDAPYGTITRFQAQWNSTRYPELAITSSDRDQEALPYLFELYKRNSRKCMSYQQFCNYSFVTLNLARDQGGDESGQLDINISFDRKLAAVAGGAGAAPGVGRLSLLVLGLYDSFLDIDADTGRVEKSWA